MLRRRTDSHGIARIAIWMLNTGSKDKTYRLNKSHNRFHFGLAIEGKLLTNHCPHIA
jgi:hypothetical protein